SDSETDSCIASPNCSISLRTREFILASSSTSGVTRLRTQPLDRGYLPTLRLMSQPGNPHQPEARIFHKESEGCPQTRSERPKEANPRRNVEQAHASRLAT